MIIRGFFGDLSWTQAVSFCMCLFYGQAGRINRSDRNWFACALHCCELSAGSRADLYSCVLLCLLQYRRMRIFVFAIYLSPPLESLYIPFFSSSEFLFQDRFYSTRIPPVDCKTLEAKTRDCRMHHTNKLTKEVDNGARFCWSFRVNFWY